MRRFFLTDEQLWRAIAENTTDLSNLMNQEVVSVPARIKMCWSNSINCSGNIGSILPSFDGAIRKSVLGPDGRHGSIIPLLFFERPGRREAAGWHSLGPVTSYGSHSAGIARQKKGRPRERP